MDVSPLAFIGNPRRAMLGGRRIVSCRGFSITRFEGTRWRLRRTRAAMEKVWECGLILLRDEEREVEEIFGEE